MHGKISSADPSFDEFPPGRLNDSLNQENHPNSREVIKGPNPVLA